MSFGAWVEEVRLAALLEEVVGGDRELTRSGSELRCLCPFHDDHKPSLRLNPAKQLWFCDVCGEGGDVFRYVEKKQGLTFFEAVQRLGERAGIRPPEGARDARYGQLAEERRRIEGILEMAVAWYQQQLVGPPLDYLTHERGLTDETIARAAIGYAPPDGTSLFRHLSQAFPAEELLKTGLFVKVSGQIHDFFRGRIVFPYLAGGRTVYMIGRKTPATPQDPWEEGKYTKLLTHSDRHPYVSEAVQNRTLYGVDSCRRGEPLLVTEGIFDVLLAHQAGFACLAPGGIRVGDDDWPGFLRVCRRAAAVYLALDTEASGRGAQAAKAIASALEREGVAARIITLPRGAEEKMDLADFVGRSEAPREDVEALMRQARRVYQVYLEEEQVPEQIEERLPRARDFVRERMATWQDEYEAEGFIRGQVVPRFSLRQTDVRGLLKVWQQARRRAERPQLRSLPGGGKGGDPEPTATAGDYRVVNRSIWRRKNTPDGQTVVVPLSNFNARITGQEVRDDGAEQARYFEIEGELYSGRKLPKVVIPASEFSALNWVTTQWGADPVIYPGQGTRDHLRAAIQLLSGSPDERRSYAHTGWRQLEEGWAYLHQGGAIGAQGTISGVEVHLEQEEAAFGEYRLPAPPEGSELRDSIRASLDLMSVGPPEVIVPILAATYRAPLAELLPARLGVFIVGKSGSFKSSITGIAQAHFGPGFTGTRLPANWSSTANKLERLAFLAKDALLVVDDFEPAGTRYEVERLHEKAERLFRAQGNLAARGRLQRDSRSSRASYPPRGIVMASGTDLPKGEGLRARVWTVAVTGNAVDTAALSVQQELAASGAHARAMAGYLRWVASRMDELRASLPEKSESLRRKAAQSLTHHARVPDNAASLLLGWETLLEFALLSEALNAREVETLSELGWNAIAGYGAEHAGEFLEEDAASRFVRMIVEMLADGHAHLADADTDGPPARDPQRWGWRKRVVSSYGDAVWDPQGTRVGWVDADGSVLLIPGSSYTLALERSSREGSYLGISQRSLWARLAEANLLVSHEEGRYTVRRTAGGPPQKRVIHLRNPYELTAGPLDSDESGSEVADW